MGGWIEQKARGVGPTIFFVLPFGELFVITSIITREGGREERDDEDEPRVPTLAHIIKFILS